MLLVFTPHASPTYVPLGLATLAGLAALRVPDCRVTLYDANIPAWEHCAALADGGAACLAFMRGKGGDFFDEGKYSLHQKTLGEIEARLTRLDLEAKKHLAGSPTETGFEALLNRLAAPMLEGGFHTVGFSLFSLGQLPWILALARRLREKTPARIIIGGAATTALDHVELLDAAPFVDGVVLGEGDWAMEALARAADLGDIPSLAWRKDGEITVNPGGARWEAESSPDPDFSGLPLSSYLNPLPVLPVLASRGCKWGRCRFCAHNSTYLGGYRPLSPESTAAALENLSRLHGAKHFYFADLYLDAPEIDALASALVELKLDVAYHALGRPTAAHTPELFRRAALSGLRWISWGVESGSARLLNVAGKGTDAGEVEEVLRAAHDEGISNLAMMIFGLPTSTDQDMEETFAFLERIYPHIDAMTASPYALFANSPFGGKPEKWGLIPQGRQTEVAVGGREIHSMRMNFAETGEDGAPRPPRGEVEVARWTGRRRWLGEVPFMEGLPCEHYLLYAARRYSTRMASTGSSFPAR